MIEKFASSHWEGGLKGGKGEITTQSGALASAPFGFASRFETGKGTNPEELIGAAHAACFSMFLSALMEKAGLEGTAVEATSTVMLDPTTEGSPTVTKVKLVTTISADATEEKIRELAGQAKAGCPISKLLKAEIEMEVKIA